jgi:hypothetical protein
MDDTVDVLIANLKVLASVPNSGRLSVRKGLLTVDNTIHGQFFIRFWYGDSRESTMYHVKNTIKNIIRASEDIMRAPGTAWKDVWNLGRIAKEMECAEFGLQNLRVTYASDAGTNATLQVMSECLQAQEVISTFVDSLRVQKYSEDEKNNQPPNFEDALRLYGSEDSGSVVREPI